MLVELQKIRQFKHQSIINRYKKDHPKSADQAETLFEDLMIFFWASKKHEELRRLNPNDETLDFTFIMDEDMKNIDHMWHVFLLYTKDYMDYCDENFGEYLHHLPDVIPNGMIKEIDYQQNLERFLNFVYEYLGEDIVCRWFAATLNESEKESEAVAV